MEINQPTPATSEEQAFWDERFSEAWVQCLKENGLQGAIGCAHLARDAAAAALTERRKGSAAVSTIAFVLDFPNEAAEELEQLRTIQADLVTALQAYVDDARSHRPGKPGSPFAERLAAAEAVLARAK